MKAKIKFDNYHKKYYYYNGIAAGRMFAANKLSDFRVAYKQYKKDLGEFIY